MINKEITFLCENEVRFIKWNNDTPFEDMWTSNFLKLDIHHYIFIRNKKQFHISFSNQNSVILGYIVNWGANIEKELYKGHSFDNCLHYLEKELCQK